MSGGRAAMDFKSGLMYTVVRVSGCRTLDGEGRRQVKEQGFNYDIQNPITIL